MKVKVRGLTGFVSTIDGVKYRVQAGDELDLPEGADWLKAGLVEQVEAPKKVTTRKAANKD